jgi:transcriptional regulator with XRE-family HTH domain
MPTTLSVVRRAAGLTAAGLASQLGVDPSLIYRYESGKRIPSDRIGKKLEQFFDVPIESLTQPASPKSVRVLAFVGGACARISPC